MMLGPKVLDEYFGQGFHKRLANETGEREWEGKIGARTSGERVDWQL